MTDPNQLQPGGRHEERLAAITAKLSGEDIPPPSVILSCVTDALSLASDLAAQLEAERAKVAELEREVAIDDQLLADRQRVLDACPCPVHGACIPHVLETLAKSKAAEEKLRAAERESFALRIWSELREYVGASLADQDNFVQHMSSDRPPSEWRFVGSLGFGGKFYPREMAVRCYPEDETPGRLAMVRNANVALARLAKRHGKALSAFDAINPDGSTGDPNPSK